jgi:hypothetical protein
VGGFDYDFLDIDGRPARVEGFLGVCLAYEFEDEDGRRLRVYVEGDEKGRATVSGREEIEAGATLGPDAIKRKVRAHLDSLLERNAAHEALWCRIDPGAELRTNRGPPPSWTPEEYAFLSRRIVERQGEGLDPVDFSTGERWALDRKTVRERAREAMRLGFLEIVERRGRWNLYSLPANPVASAPVEPQPETLRWVRFEFERRRRALGPRPTGE